MSTVLAQCSYQDPLNFMPKATQQVLNNETEYTLHSVRVANKGDKNNIERDTISTLILTDVERSVNCTAADYL